MNLNKVNMIRTTKMSFEFATKGYVKTKKMNLFEKIVNKREKKIYYL